MQPDSISFYQARDYQPEECVGYLLRQVVVALTQAVDRELAPADLTNAQWLPLFKLYRKQADTPRELARCCGLDAGAMTRTLDRLEAKGLCQRVRSQTDRRVVHIALTPAGLEAAQNLPAVLSRVQNAHLAGFNAEEFLAFKGYLQRMLDNAQP